MNISINNMKPSIAVIIPAYNSEKTIIRTLNSVKGQTRSPDEVIIVDDGSVDKTYEFVKNYIKYNNLEWVLLSQSNGGPSKARDNGIRSASTTHIALIDADDCWLPSKLEYSLEFMISQKLDVIGANVRAIDPEIKCELIRPMASIFYNPYCTSTVMFLKKKYEEVNGFDVNQRYSEDYKLWLNFLWKNNRCGKISNSLVIYANESTAQHDGLSSKLWLMQINEVGNFRLLKKLNILPAHLSVLAEIVSWIKFANRLIIKFFNILRYKS